MSVMSETSDSVCDCAPTPAEIRAALDHMLFSSVFSRSPQLGAFLRFVTEAVLHGKGDRIKAYTIGVEVLRRDTTFDPQIDPIVRVEATRLRRAHGALLRRSRRGRPDHDRPAARLLCADLPPARVCDARQRLR